MKLTSVILAAGLLAVPGVAFAQSAPKPKDTSAPGMVSTPAPTNKTQLPGDIRSKPPRDNAMLKTKLKKSRHLAKRKSHRMTTGSAKPTAEPLDSANGTGKKP